MSTVLPCEVPAPEKTHMLLGFAINIPVGSASVGPNAIFFFFKHNQHSYPTQCTDSSVQTHALLNLSISCLTDCSPQAVSHSFHRQTSRHTVSQLGQMREQLAATFNSLTLPGLAPTDMFVPSAACGRAAGQLVTLSVR